ncbi:hypothetical protein LWI29_004972 [Acer saccharum]|uniref:Protein FAR1-RELATED SEQUENCE n=1 Tax=Acer saccharum TaxID=4024 RepID=A0AA39SBG9_ACESA|nr:hypothetical protein LWI29_004972 [Acer saccharum]
MHGHEIQADHKLQQTYQYRSLCSIFTRISSRASESQKAYNLAHEHASNLARLVEDILRLEIAGNVLKTGHESEDVNLEVNSIQDSNLMKAKGLKKKGSSRGRRRIKSSLEKALAKRKKSSKSLTHSQTFETSTHLLPMISNGLNPSMVYAPHSPTVQLQAYNMHNLFSWTPNEQDHTMKLQELTPNEQAQTMKQQELVQQNEATASLVFKDSQASTCFSSQASTSFSLI